MWSPTTRDMSLSVVISKNPPQRFYIDVGQPIVFMLSDIHKRMELRIMSEVPSALIQAFVLFCLQVTRIISRLISIAISYSCSTFSSLFCFSLGPFRLPPPAPRLLYSQRCQPPCQRR